MKYKFQMKNGHIYDGNTEIAIVDHIAEIKEEITPALQLVIDAHGGQLVKELKPKPRKGRKVKPVKWSESKHEDLGKTGELLETIREVVDDSTSP